MLRVSLSGVCLLLDHSFTLSVIAPPDSLLATVPNLGHVWGHVAIEVYAHIPTAGGYAGGGGLRSHARPNTVLSLLIVALCCPAAKAQMEVCSHARSCTRECSKKATAALSLVDVALPRCVCFAALLRCSLPRTLSSAVGKAVRGGSGKA